MKKQNAVKRAASLVLALAMALGIFPVSLPEQKAEAADFTLGSGFTDPTISVATMYYWKEGVPPIVGLNGGKREGSSLGVEYPIFITWNDTYFYNPSAGSVENGDNSVPPHAISRSYRVDHDLNSYNYGDEYSKNHKLPAGYLAHWRTYESDCISLFETTGVAKSLKENGVAASMDVPTRLYAVPTEEGYALELGKGSNKWLIGETYYYNLYRKARGYEVSIDWYLNTKDYNKESWIDPNHLVPVRTASASDVADYKGDQDGNEHYDLSHRTWTMHPGSDGLYTIGTDGTAAWYIEKWLSSGVSEWRSGAKDFVNGIIWDHTETWLSHNYDWGYGGGRGIQSWGGYKGDWSHAQASGDSRYKFAIYYGEPNTVSFIQTDTRVQDGQVVNLDGPIVIGENATITVEEGGVLAVSGWVMNGGFIMVKPGGMLIVQDQERLDGTKQYGVINCYQEKPGKKYGRISCDGIMIVNRDCKVFGAGLYGLQFGEGAQCVNYGQLASENFEVYTDHTIENRGDTSAVYAGWGLTGGGFAMANKQIPMGATFSGQGNIERSCTVRMARDAVYGPGARRVYINSKAKSQTGMDNRTGLTTAIEPYVLTYTPILETEAGIYYVVDKEGYRYDWYDSLNSFARFEYANGKMNCHLFGGRYIFKSNSQQVTRARNVADYSPEKNNFFVKAAGTTYWYDGAKKGFLDENALTDVYYYGNVSLPAGVKGAQVEIRQAPKDAQGPVAPAKLEPIVDGGVYYLQPDDTPNLYLYGLVRHAELSNAFTDNRTLWEFKKDRTDENGVTYYSIRNVGNGYYMGYHPHGNGSDETVRMFDPDLTASYLRYWAVEQDGESYIISPEVRSEFAMGVDEKAKGGGLMVYKRDTTAWNQRWKLIKEEGISVTKGPADTSELYGTSAPEPKLEPIEVGKEYYIVPALNEDLLMETSYSAMMVMGRVASLTTGRDYSLSKRWTFKEDQIGFSDKQHYRIRNVEGYGLTLDYSLAANGRSVTADSMITSHQGERWIMIPDGDAYVIASAMDDNYALTVPNSDAREGKELEIFWKNGEDSQRWKLVPVE